MAPSDNPPVAIKGFSLSARPASSQPASSKSKSALGKRARLESESDDEDDHECRSRGRAIDISGFGEEGAVSAGPAREERKVLVIPRKENTWVGAQARQAKKNLLPEEEIARREGRGVKREVVVEEEKEVVYGLVISERRKDERGEHGIKVEDEESVVVKEEEEEKPRSVDEEALEALLGERRRTGPDLVIPAKLNDEDAYRRDVQIAPDVPSLDDYDRMPPTEFGAAFLRGLGWKGPVEGKKKEEVKRRPNRLGLGAKELREHEDLGEWGAELARELDGKRSGDKRKPRKERLQTPAEYKKEQDEKKARRRRDDDRGSHRGDDRGGYTDDRKYERRERSRERDDRRGDRRGEERRRSRDRDDRHNRR